MKTQLLRAWVQQRWEHLKQGSTRKESGIPKCHSERSEESGRVAKTRITPFGTRGHIPPRCARRNDTTLRLPLRGSFKCSKANRRTISELTPRRSHARHLAGQSIDPQVAARRPGLHQPGHTA